MILTPLWMYMIFNEDKIMAKTEQLTKEAEKAGMTLKEYLESISPLNDKKKLSWLGKNCKDCGNEKCKKLGTLPKGYDCALWQSESEDKMIGEEDVSKIIGERFKDFINTQGYDPYEVAVLCSEVLKENGISYMSNKHMVGVRLFEKSEDNE